MNRKEIIETFRGAVFLKKEFGRNIDPEDPKIYEAMDAAEKLLEHNSTRNESWPTNLLMEIGILPDVELIDELKENLTYALKTLDKDEYSIMLSYYKDGLNTQQIAEKMETSAASSAITHIRKKALSKLMHRVRIRLICIGKDAANTADSLRQKYVEEIESMKRPERRRGTS